MFFKKEIKNCLKLNDVLKIVLPDKSVSHVKPTSQLNIGKCGRTDLDARSDDLNDHLKDVLNERMPNLVDEVTRIRKSTHVNLVFNRHEFLRNSLGQFKHGVENYADFFGHEPDNRKILIEFSSPNIAKKLHFGNFRSTVIGLCLSNLFKYKNCDLERINYYGDWGTQFGVLSAGFDKYGNHEQLKQNAIKHLSDVYVKASQEAESCGQFYEECKKRFALLEGSSDEGEEQAKAKKQWELFRNLSLEEYARDYRKLGVEFDTVQYESMFDQKAKQIFTDRTNPNLVFNEDGSVCFKLEKKIDKGKEEVLIKNDGSTLYLSRDVAAAIDRKNQFNFDICYYVVDISQRNHFKKIKQILKTLGHDWTSQLVHLPFGRINKMSTRKGTATLLDEILEVAEKLSADSTLENKNSKVTAEELESTKFDLALASLIANIFKHKRTTDLDFDLNYFTDQSTDNSGVSLMYTYARLCNLKLNSGLDFDPNCELDFDALEGNESYHLLLLLAQFDEIIEQSCFLLEPRSLMDYLFNLKTAINRAYSAYPVKGQPKSCGQTRLLLFHCAQQVYERGLRLSGIRPQDRI